MTQAQHYELIEYRLARRTKAGQPTQFHQDGAQSVFSLSRARKILRNIGPAWQIVHMSTLEPAPEKD